MCGIYCYLKCNKSDTNNTSSSENTVLSKLKDYLKHRGPDDFSEYRIDIGCNWTLNFAGSVLWMQGLELTTQPLIDDECNCLLWNGDVFNGLVVKHENLSDTVKISQSLSKVNGIEITAIMSSIQGPYAFIYLDVKRQRLYFGRDRLGRHSLLWSNDMEEGFVLTSVGKRNVLDFKEVPAVGIFFIDLNSSDLGSVTLYPWSDISAETLLNIDQESVLRVEVSSESVQSPIIIDGSNREKLYDPQHPLNQYPIDGVIDSHQIRDFMEKLQSDSDIKKSVEKLNYLLRNAVQIDVTQEELTKERDRIISDLIYPLNTVLDESLGCALWFASRRKGYLVKQNGPDTLYSSPARVLLLGMGADELFGGYRRHRTAFNLEGWSGLRNELELDLARISTRNLGRDNRIISDHGCQGRLPYLDETVVSYASSLQPWERCYPKPAFPPGVGDKLLLRLAAWNLGLHYAAVLPKRAFQFGSRIANSKEKASDVSSRL